MGNTNVPGRTHPRGRSPGAHATRPVFKGYARLRIEKGDEVGIAERRAGHFDPCDLETGVALRDRDVRRDRGLIYLE